MPNISGDEDCIVHKVHAPTPYGTDLHHVWPKGMGGPDVAENKIPLCSTGHQNVHRFLEHLVKGEGSVDWELARKFHPNERKYAKLGYDRWKRNAL